MMSDYIRGLDRLMNESDSIAQVKPIVIGPGDRYAAKVIKYIVTEVLPPDATVGDAEGVLLTALWWIQTWASNEKAEKLGADNEGNDD